MGCFSGEQEGDEVPYQKEIDDDFNGSVKARTTTDKPYLGLFALCIGILGGLTMYCTVNGDTGRLVNGFDSCGNVCGEKNFKDDDPQFVCKGEDMTDKKFLLYEKSPYPLDETDLDISHLKRRCVASCADERGYVEVFNRCLPRGYNNTATVEKVGLWLDDALTDLKTSKFDILKMTLFALVLSLILVYSLRTHPEFMVWTLLLGFTAMSLLLTTALWLIWMARLRREDINDDSPAAKEYRGQSTNYVFFALLWTSVSIGVLIVMIVMRKRIPLVIRLFKEAGKAVEDMPFLLLQPVFTFIAILITYVGCVEVIIVAASSGRLTQDPAYKDVYYRMDFFMKFTIWFALFMWFWLVQFCIGCQHMVIAGSAASWFFTRDKNQLQSPISMASKNLFSYHLGSVAIGSLLIAIIHMIRVVVLGIKHSLKYSKSGLVRMLYGCFAVGFALIEDLLRYWTRNAYVQVAIFGVEFCKGGSRAFKLLTSNAMKVWAINSVGDFVLFLGKGIVVALTVFLGYQVIDLTKVQNPWVPLSVIGLIAFFIVHCFVTVYEMVIDTIFICFCEDSEMNDGLSKPYYMSKGLMEFVENSKKILGKTNSQNEVNA